MGWKHRSTATNFAKAGKIVVTADGMVDVDASIARLKVTADPLKEGVRKRHERDRRQRADQAEGSTRVDPNDTTYQLLTKHRAAAELHRSELLRLEFEEKEGRLVDVEAVRKRAMETSRAARNAVLNMRYRLDPLLAGVTDEAKRSEIWDRETRQICEELARAIAAPVEAADGGG